MLPITRLIHCSKKEKIECHSFEKEIIKDFGRFLKKSTLDENGCKQRANRVFCIASYGIQLCRDEDSLPRHTLSEFLGLFDAEKNGDSISILASKSVHVLI